MFLEADIAIVACVLALTNAADINSAFLKLCEITHEETPLAGCARYLAGVLALLAHVLARVLAGMLQAVCNFVVRGLDSGQLRHHRHRRV